MNEMWPCDCEDKRNSPGVKKCRKCGMEKPEYTTDGKHIIKKEKPRPEPGSQSFIKSTLKFIKDGKKNE